MKIESGNTYVVKSFLHTRPHCGTDSLMMICLREKRDFKVLKVCLGYVRGTFDGYDNTWSIHNLDLMPAKRLSNNDAQIYLQNQLLIDLTGPDIKSLDYDVEFQKNKLWVGCQSISKKDAIKLANRILWAYGEE